MAYNEERGFSQAGIWVPADASGAGLVFGNTAGNCRWVRTGDLVQAIFNVTYPVTADASAAIVTGLPFVARTTTSSMYGGFFNYQDSSLVLSILIDLGDDQFRFPKNNGISALNSELSGRILRGTVVYEV